ALGVAASAALDRASARAPARRLGLALLLSLAGLVAMVGIVPAGRQIGGQDGVGSLGAPAPDDPSSASLSRPLESAETIEKSVFTLFLQPLPIARAEDP
ncbi:MAG: hypothetical protein MI919_24300, partial [Holophagales bacterium]|nr:hypothetical protein [Holophagales bacterium]